MSSYLPLLWRDCGTAFWVGRDDALRCGGGRNGAARLLGAAAFRSVDLVHSYQLNFMLLTNIILINNNRLNFISLYLDLFFRRGRAVRRRGGGGTAVFRRVDLGC